MQLQACYKTCPLRNIYWWLINLKDMFKLQEGPNFRQLKHFSTQEFII